MACSSGYEFLSRRHPPAYPAGALLFSTAFLAKPIGVRIESAALARVAFGGLVSVGGALLLVALLAGVRLAAGLVGVRAAVPEPE